MNREIERKFLVDVSKLPNLVNYPQYHIIQGYLSTEPVVRIRTTRKDFITNAYLTIKGPGLGSHLEFEISIPYKDATILLELCKTKLEKTRFLSPVRDDKNLTWEIDFFEGDNKGLVIAEIELPEKNYLFDMPDWCLEEVTMDQKYTNSYLSENPYKGWDINNQVNQKEEDTLIQ